MFTRSLGDQQHENIRHLNNAFALVVGIASYQHINKLPPVGFKDAQDAYDLLV